MTKVAILGNGQVGSAMSNVAKESTTLQFEFYSRTDVDLSKPKEIEAFVNQLDVNFIINCAAYTQVDKAETEQDLARAINAEAPGQLARLAEKQGIRFMHISTDYVFDGEHFRPYVETDPTNPNGVYGTSKLQGEMAVLEASTRAYIFRTSWVYHETGHNFLKTMLRLGAERSELNVVADQIGSPTYAGDLAQAICSVIASITQGNDTPGIYHFSNEGVCSWYDFAVEIMNLANLDCTISPIRSEAYPTPAKRPHFSLLDKHKIKAQFGLTIPHWKQSVKTCMNLTNVILQ